MNILRALKAWPWYYWLIALAVSVGIVALRPRAAGGVPTIDPDNAKAGEKFRIDQLIGSIKDKAAALRSGLANDPLAANLLGVDYSLVKAGDETKVAASSARAEELRTMIASVENTIGSAHAGWQANRFGGVGQDAYQAFVAKHEAELGGYLNELAGLFK